VAKISDQYFKKMRGSTAGMDDLVLSPKMSYHSILLELLDTMYGTFIVAPLVVGYWRGTWDLLGYYLYPDQPLISNLISLAIGIIGHMIFTVFQSCMTNHLRPDRCRLTYYFWSRCYTIVFGFVCVNGWRGGWQLIDMYTEMKSSSIFLTTLTCLLILGALKSVRNITATPFVIIPDDANAYFEIPTYFKTSVRSNFGISSSVINCFLS
jgi:Fuseless